MNKLIHRNVKRITKRTVKKPIWHCRNSCLHWWLLIGDLKRTGQPYLLEQAGQSWGVQTRDLRLTQLCNVGLDSDVPQTWSVKCPAAFTWSWETDRQKKVALLQAGEGEESDFFHTGRGLLLLWIMLMAAAWGGCFGWSKQRFERIMNQDYYCLTPILQGGELYQIVSFPCGEKVRSI